VLRDYTVELLVSLAPQLDRHDLRRILAGNQAATWPAPPTWTDLSQVITN
jgi:LysR family cys regulon transcriptional activator